MQRKVWFLISGAAVACSFAPMTKKAPAVAANPPVAPSAVVQKSASATQLWQDNCARCHGAQAQGASAPSLVIAEKFDQKWDRPFYDAIKNGRSHMGMEAFGESLSDEQIWALVVKIREFQGWSARQAIAIKPTNGLYRSKHASYRVEDVVTSGLRTPWGIDWLPDGRMLVTNRGGSLVWLREGSAPREINGIPAVRELGQGGLMEVAVHPNYAKNGWIYLAYTEPKASNPGQGMTKIVRGKLRWSGNDASWTGQETIWEAPQEYYSGAGVHFGSRIAFDGKGNIVFAIGERGTNERVQDLSTPYGKIYRLTEDGQVPKDNPFAGGKAFKGTYSYGHRNPQGLVFGLDGTLWDTEHGPRGGDEINRIEPGKNYGWPLVAFSINYNDMPFRTPWGDGFQLPVFRWLPSIGACGLDVARGAAFPGWKGDLLAGGLSGQNLDRIRIKGNQVVEREALFIDLGRVRDVSVAPNGTVYVALNQPDKIVRLVPAK